MRPKSAQQAIQYLPPLFNIKYVEFFFVNSFSANSHRILLITITVSKTDGFERTVSKTDGFERTVSKTDDFEMYPQMKILYVILNINAIETLFMKLD